MRRKVIYIIEDGTADITATFTDGKAESDTYTVNGIDYTLTATSDTYTATSTTGAEQKATEVTVSAVGAEESTAKGVNIGATTYNGTATAKFTVGDDYTHTLTFTYGSGEISKVADNYNGKDSTLTDSGSGTYVINSTSGLTVKVATDAFADGTLTADELTVTTDWNNGATVTFSDTNTLSLSDGLTVTENGEGNLIYWQLDDSHYYAFVFQDNAVKKFTETKGVGGITFSNGKSIAFSTDGKNYAAVTSTVNSTGFTVTDNNAEAQKAGKVEVAYTTAGRLTITPSSSTYTTIKGELLATNQLSTAADGKITGSTLEITASTEASNYTSGNGNFGITFTAPTYGDGVADGVGGESYGFNVNSLVAFGTDGSEVSGASQIAGYYGGKITVTVGTTKVDFDGTADNGSLSAFLKQYSQVALGTGGLIGYNSSSKKWYTVTSALQTNGTFKLTTTSTTYTGAYLKYDGNSGTLTYVSTNQSGSDVKATDRLVSFTLGTTAGAGTITVGKARYYDADNSATSSLGTATKDGIDGTMDSYILGTASSQFSTVWSAKIGTAAGSGEEAGTAKDLSGFKTMLDKIATIGTTTGTATGTDDDLSDNTSKSDAAGNNISGVATAITGNVTPSLSTAFDGITYYHVSITKDETNRDATKVNGNVGYEAANDIDGNAPGAIVGVVDTWNDKTYGYRDITYSLKLDNNGNPYIEVGIKTNVTASDPDGDDKKVFDSTKSWTAFDISNTTGAEAFVMSGRTAYADSANYADVTTIPSKSDLKYDLLGNTGNSVIDGGTLDTTKASTKAATVESEAIFTNLFQVGSAEQSSDDVYYWMGVAYTEASVANSFIKTGNLSVKLDDTHIAVVGVEKGENENGFGTTATIFKNDGNQWVLDTSANTSEGLTTDYAKATTTIEGTEATLGAVANLTVGTNNYTLVYATSTTLGNAPVEQFQATALPSWVGSDPDTQLALANAFLAGNLTLVEGVKLGNDSHHSYALAITKDENNDGTANDPKILAAAYKTGEWNAAGTTFQLGTWASTSATQLSEDSTVGWTNISSAGEGVNVGIALNGATGVLTVQDNRETAPAAGLTYSAATGGNVKVTGGTGVFTVDVSKLGLGDLAYLKVTLKDSGTVDKVEYCDSTGNSLNPEDGDAIYTAYSETTLANALLSSTWSKNTVLAIKSTSGTGTTANGLAASASTAINLAGGTNGTTEVEYSYYSGAVTSGGISATDLADTDFAKTANSDKVNNNTVTASLANLTLEDGQSVFKATYGGSTFYIVGEIGDTANANGTYDVDPVAVYDAAGIQLTNANKNEGLYVNNDALYVGNGTQPSSAMTLTYDAEDGLTISGKYEGVSTVATLSGGEVTEVGKSSLLNAALLGAEDWASIQAYAAADADKNNLLNKVKAEYITGTLGMTSGDYATKLIEGAGLSYEANDAGGYTGIISLGSNSVTSQSSPTPLLNDSGTTVTSLYAKYTFGTDNSFALTGLYSDATAATAITDSTYYSIGADSQTVVIGDISYKLSATTQSEVTIALTDDSVIEYDKASIKLDSSAITNSKTDVDTTAVAFRTESSSSTTTSPAFQFELTGTDISKVSTYTIDGTEVTTTEVSGATFANGVASWSDATTSYTAKWTDVNGNGTVDTSDTVAITSTPLNASNQMTASVNLTASGATTAASYTFTATDTTASLSVSATTSIFRTCIHNIV